jgi:dihydrofolate synthase/folylpolyglutamate synthase
MSSPYSQTLSYLYSRLPMFQRIGAAAYKANLDNTIYICKVLGNPENKFRSIHIAGTNGKGSSSHMLAAILQSAGLKTGLYTSPHLKDFRERIRINGKMIPRQYIVDFVKKHQHRFESIEPSFFEWTVGLAFDYFANEKVDVAIIETGLGGRLDSTNVINPLLSLITNISYDHMNLLGNTLRKIAAEKAGIIKHAVPVVISETQTGTDPVFKAVARKQQAPLAFADQEFKVQIAKTKQSDLTLTVRKKGKVYLKDLQCGLAGYYQQKNIPGVLRSIEALNDLGYGITEKQIRKGIANVKELTGLRGRWETLSKDPLTIADTGHNEAGIQEVLAQIRKVPHQRLLFVLGMVSDKDIGKILKMLPRNAVYFFCKASVPRALDEKALQSAAGVAGLKGRTYKTVKKALHAAQAEAKKGDLVFVGGSTFTVADAL